MYIKLWMHMLLQATYASFLMWRFNGEWSPFLAEHHIVEQIEFDLQDGGGKAAGGSPSYGVGLAINVHLFCAPGSLKYCFRLSSCQEVLTHGLALTGVITSHK